MRVVTQKVNKAKVFFEGKEIAQIPNGLVLYMGINRGEAFNSVQWLTDLIKTIRYEDGNCHEILILSQFTLFGEFKGSKPSFHHAEKNEIAEKYFYDAVEKIKIDLRSFKINQDHF